MESDQKNFNFLCPSSDEEDADLHGKIHHTYFFASLAGIGMVGSICFFIVVVEYFVRMKAPFGGFPLLARVEGLRYVLYGVAGGLVVLMHGTRRLKPAHAYEDGRPGRMDPAGARLARLMKRTIFSYILCEAIAVTGLMLFFLSGNRRDFYALFGISLLSLIICFPRFRDWLAFVTADVRTRGCTEE